MRTLIWKELREHTRWLPVGLIVIAAVVYLAAPSRHTDALLAARLVTQLAIVTPLLAFTLGIVQAYRDLQPSGSAYLNHRGVTAHQIFMAKVLAGFAIYATAVVIPLLLLAAWIAMQGMHWVPMRPAQVVPALVFALASFALHPAAMLMFARDASWWGTRVLPLVPAAAALLPLFAGLRIGGMRGAAWGVLGAALSLVWLVCVARQGWRQLSTDPPASLSNRALRPRWLLPAYLTVGTLSVIIAGILFVGETVISWTRPTAYEPEPFNLLAVDGAAGTLWMMTFIQEYDPQIGSYKTKAMGGDEVVPGKQVDPLRADNLPQHTQTFVVLGDPQTSLASTSVLGSYGSSDGFFSNFISLYDNRFRYAFDERGYVLRYSHFPQTHWQATIAADGVYPPGDWSGQPFTSNPLSPSWGMFAAIYAAGYDPPWVDENGVYLVDQASGTIRRLIDRKIEGLAWIAESDYQSPTLLIRSEDKLFEYRLLDGSGSGAWLQDGTRQHSQGRSHSRSLYDLPLNAQLIGTMDLPADALLPGMRAARSSSGWYIAPTDTSTTVFHVSVQGKPDVINFQIEPGTSSPPFNDELKPDTVAAGLMPGMMFVGIAATDAWVSRTQPNAKPLARVAAEHPVTVATGGVVFLLVSLLSLWLTRRVSYRRGLSPGQVRIWSWSVLLLGLAAPLSVVAIHRKVVREPCPHCQQPRRVDDDRCEHCGAEWEPPQPEGIEIIDAHRLPQHVEGAAV